jgi:hypothetical protein
MARTGIEDGFQGQSVDIALAVKEVMKDNVKVTIRVTNPNPDLNPNPDPDLNPNSKPNPNPI